jgi:hypothetical protein
MSIRNAESGRWAVVPKCMFTYRGVDRLFVDLDSEVADDREQKVDVVKGQLPEK